MSNITSAQTQLTAVIGSPIAHSLSPLIHNSFAQKLGLPYTYMAFDVPTDKLGEFIKAAKLLNMAGFNLTMPLKRHVLPYIDVLVGGLNSVNTVVIREGRLFGFNTDGEGFVKSIEDAGLPPDGIKAVIIGTGGAAEALNNELKRRGADVKMVSARKDDLIKECEGCSLIVNATPLGMHGLNEDYTSFDFLASAPKAVVYDLIYVPQETRLLSAAKAAGHKTFNGLPMLVNQAALAFKHFTGVMPNDRLIDDVMESL